MTLVLLHGFTGSPGSWSRVITQLPVGRRVLAPALAGHAPDAPPAESFMGEVDRLCSIVRAASDGPVHLAGYSMGARVALGMLVSRPESFARATLIGARAGLSDTAEREERRNWEQRWARMLEDEGIDAFVDAWEALPMWASQARVDPEKVAAQRRTRLAHEPSALASAMRALGLSATPDLTPRLEEVRVPVDLMVGARDEKFSRLADELLDRLPNARRLTLADAGHNLLLERPDAVADALNQVAGE